MATEASNEPQGLPSTYHPPSNDPQPKKDNGPVIPQHSWYPTEGWYVAMACIGGVLVADTRFGPIAFGILTVALIFQLTLLLQGK